MFSTLNTMIDRSRLVTDTTMLPRWNVSATICTAVFYGSTWIYILHLYVVLTQRSSLSLSLVHTHWYISTHTISAAGWQVLYCSEWSVSTGDFSSHRSMGSRTDLALWVYVCSWHLSALAAEGLLARTGTNFSLGPAQPQPLMCVCAYWSGLVIITAAANSERRPQERRWRRAEREARTAENTNVQGEGKKALTPCSTKHWCASEQIGSGLRKYSRPGSASVRLR